VTVCHKSNRAASSRAATGTGAERGGGATIASAVRGASRDREKRAALSQPLPGARSAWLYCPAASMRDPRTPTAAILLPAALLALGACAAHSAARTASADSVAAAPVPAPAAAPAAPAAADGFFSAEQAVRGGETYRQVCSECHARSEFRGPDFEWRWRRQTAWELFREISTTMPEDRPGSLGEEVYVAIVAYLLSLNDYAAGGHDLAPTREALSSVPLGTGAPRAPAPAADREPD